MPESVNGSLQMGLQKPIVDIAISACTYDKYFSHVAFKNLLIIQLLNKIFLIVR